MPVWLDLVQFWLGLNHWSFLLSVHCRYQILLVVMFFSHPYAWIPPHLHHFSSFSTHRVPSTLKQTPNLSMLLIVTFYHVTSSMLQDNFWCSKCSDCIDLDTIPIHTGRFDWVLLPGIGPDTDVHKDPGRSVRILSPVSYEQTEAQRG